jgi:hypothetical protein
MKLTTIALAIAFALPSTFALAGPMNLASPVVVHSEASLSAARHAPMATKPRYLSGITLAPIMHDPSGPATFGD